MENIQIERITFREPNPYELNHKLGLSTVEYDLLPFEEKPRVASIVFKYYLNGNCLHGSVKTFTTKLDNDFKKVVKEKLYIK